MCAHSCLRVPPRVSAQARGAVLTVGAMLLRKLERGAAWQPGATIGPFPPADGAQTPARRALPCPGIACRLLVPADSGWLFWLVHL